MIISAFQYSNLQRLIKFNKAERTSTKTELATGHNCRIASVAALEGDAQYFIRSMSPEPHQKPIETKHQSFVCVSFVYVCVRIFFVCVQLQPKLQPKNQK